MTKRNRAILLLFLAVLFLMAAPSMVLYSLGYRFDFETKKITQIGGFYFKVWPKSSQIYFEGKEIKKTDFFFGAAYFDNLLPKRYAVEIKKDGYHPWKKILEIKEKQVTDAKNIVLLPKDSEFALVTKNVEEFFVSPNEKVMILKETDENGWALKSFEVNRNIKSHLLHARDLSATSGVELLSLRFSADSKEISLELAVGKNTEYFTLDVGTTPAVLTKKERPQNLSDPSVNGTAVSAKQKDPQGLYYIDEEKQILYIFSRALQSFEKFFEGTEGAKFSPDLKKLAYFSNSEIWVLFLDREFGQPQKSAGEKLLIARFSEKIGSVSWLTNHYLVFSSGNKIKAAEIDDRDGINMVDLAEFKQPQVFFNQNDKKLYILSEGKLYALANLIP